MHIEISAGGLSGGIAVASFQNGMKKYISGTDGMISSFKAVRTKTYNLNGGVGTHLESAVNQALARERTEEQRKSGAETVQAKSNSFLDLAIRVDKSVANMVKQDRKELYGKYPSLKPSPGQGVKDPLSDAWNWLCKAGQDIAKDLHKNKEVKRKLSHKKESAMETGNDIIPVSEMNVMNDRQSGKAFVGNLLSFQVDVLIQRALNFQTRRGESMFNQFLKYGQGSQGASLHTDGNLRKKAAFNLIVL